MSFKICRKCQIFDPMPTVRGLDLFNEFGLPMEITEITYLTFGTSAKAEVLKWHYTIYFSTPNMESAIYWNTVEGTAHTVENRMNGGLFHADFTLKFSAIMLKKLFGEVWHTKTELTTDQNGFAEFCGFFGEYEAFVNGKKLNFGIHKTMSKIKI